MWPSIPLVVPQATLGTAMGLATSVQMIGIGLSNVIVGQILGTKSRWESAALPSLQLIGCAVKMSHHPLGCFAQICKRGNPIVFFCFHFASELKIPLWRWQQMMVFMLANTIACIFASVSLNIVDRKQVRIGLLWSICPMEAQFCAMFQRCALLQSHHFVFYSEGSPITSVGAYNLMTYLGFCIMPLF